MKRSFFRPPYSSRLWRLCCLTVETKANGHRWCPRISDATSTPSRPASSWCLAKSKARLCCLSLQALREWSKLPCRQRKGKQTRVTNGPASLRYLWRASCLRMVWCETPQRGGGRGHHPLLGVSGDWMEPSDSWRPEERLVRGPARRQKPHASRGAALLEEQVRRRRRRISTGKALVQSWILLQVFFQPVLLLIILISEHLCSQVKNGIWSPVLPSHFFVVLEQQNKFWRD